MLHFYDKWVELPNRQAGLAAWFPWKQTYSPNKHVSELSKFAVAFILNFNETPLGLTAEDLLPTNCYLTVTANHSKWNVLLQLKGCGVCKKMILKEGGGAKNAK